MSHVVIVQTGNQQSIHKVSLAAGSSVVIGRGWQNDVIVNDGYVDATHLEFSMDEAGGISVKDLGSRNGIRLARRRVSGMQPYTPGATIAVGETSLTLHDAEGNVEPALKQDTVHSISRVFGSFFWVVLASLIAGVALYGNARWIATEELTTETLANMFLGVAAIIFCWSLVAGLIGKLFRHETYVKLHWTFSCCIVAAGFLVTLLTDALRFNLDSDAADVAIQYGVLFVIIAVLAYGTLSLSTRMGTTGRFGMSSVIALLPVILGLIVPTLAEDHEKWTSHASIERINQHPALLLKDPVPLAVHIQNTDALFATLEDEIGNIERMAPDDARPPVQPTGDIKISENSAEEG